MKHSIFIVTCLLMFSCGQTEPEEGEDQNSAMTVEEEVPTLEGAWEMRFYQLYNNDEVSDTVTMNEGYRQVKIYYDGHVMWSRKQPKDSVQMFGYGTYFIDGNKFSENMEFGSHYMMNILDSMRVFNWELDIGDDYYVQTEVNENGARVYSETYRRID